MSVVRDVVIAAVATAVFFVLLGYVPFVLVGLLVGVLVIRRMREVSRG